MLRHYFGSNTLKWSRYNNYRQLIHSYWYQFHQRFTSSYYARRFRKVQNTVKMSVFFALLGSVHALAFDEMLMSHYMYDKNPYVVAPFTKV